MKKIALSLVMSCALLASTAVMAQDAKPAYLHICEGATQLADGRKNDTTGKLISYLVSDFIKELTQE